MSARPGTFWIAWLAAVLAGVLAFGAALVLLPAAMEDAFNLLFFGAQEGPTGFQEPAVDDYVRFVHGVLGAVMIGWSVLMLLAVLGPLRRGERWPWTALTASLATWFAVDTAFSLSRGYPENAALNLVIAVLVAIPLAATRPRRPTAR